ncbi:MAG: hypothetical protein KJO53_14595 [Eudoraea sp.]|nr:hypothetical protein [Eudoraea sp.]
MRNSINKLIQLFFLLVASVIYAQDDPIVTTSNDDEEKIDASKPTNFYSFIDNTLEYSSQPNQNVMGYRGKLTLAPSEANLVLIEVPLLYNDRTSKFGLGDLRARYFFMPYKNYDRFVGAFGPSIDIFAPTGSFENGLGSGRWVISPGITVGLMVADWIQLFPILSYKYASKPVFDNPPASIDEASNGLSFQIITPIIFSESFFVQLTPVFNLNDFRFANEDRFVQEVFAAYSLKPTMQLTGFYSGNFEDKIHTFSLGLTVFF